jgi:hypothetical protein
VRGPLPTASPHQLQIQAIRKVVSTCLFGADISEHFRSATAEIIAGCAAPSLRDAR